MPSSFGRQRPLTTCNELATDTFFVRDGKITVQSFVGKTTARN